MRTYNIRYYENMQKSLLFQIKKKKKTLNFAQITHTTILH